MSDAPRDSAPAHAAAMPAGTPPPAGETCRRLKSAELLAGAREILIEHSGEIYRLRHTSQGKLILTK